MARETWVQSQVIPKTQKMVFDATETGCLSKAIIFTELRENSEFMPFARGLVQSELQKALLRISPNCPEPMKGPKALGTIL